MPDTPIAHLSVGIVGAGFGGLGTAIHLKQAGSSNFQIFEQRSGVGGVWRANTYPGAACDVPSHLYSLGCRLGHKWPRRYAQQAAILEYMEDITDEYGLRDHLHLNTGITQARWDSDARQWVLTTETGEEHAFDLLVTACGQLTNPSIPPIPGLDRFEGHQFHSAEWDHDHDLRGEDVAVVGTGASAIQFVPEVAKLARHVTVYQRSAPWTLPRFDREYADWERRLFKRFPLRVKLSRLGIFLYAEYFTRTFLGKWWANPPLRFISNWQRKRALKHHPELLEQCTPDYTFGCNRVLFTSEWFETQKRENVTLVNASVARITDDSVVADGGDTRPADTIIFGTGFSAGDFVAPMEIIGADGQALREVWGDTPAAHLGITVPRFPNLFILYGPNTNHGSASVPYTLECQIAYLLSGMRALVNADCQTIDVKPEALARWRAEMDRRSEGTTWTTGGCGNWYVNARGENTNNWPGSWLEYRRRTKQLDTDNYVLA